MRSSSRAALFFAGLLLVGCATPDPVPCPGPQVVEIVKTRTVAVPSEFTVPCAEPPECAGVTNAAVAAGTLTNGQLLACAQGRKLQAAECNSRLNAIRQLK